MPALVAGIDAFPFGASQGVDSRNKSGHDEDGRDEGSGRRCLAMR